MHRKWLRLTLTLIYSLVLILNGTGLLLPGTLPVAQAAATSPFDSAAEPPDGPLTSTCRGYVPTTAANRLSVQLWQVDIILDRYGDRTRRPRPVLPAGAVPAPPTIQSATGDLVRITVRITNTGAVDATGYWPTCTSTTVRLTRWTFQPTWTNWSNQGSETTFDGTLAPGEMVDGYVEYITRPNDPVTVDYRPFAWANYHSARHLRPGHRLDNDIDLPGLGPDITVDFDATPRRRSWRPDLLDADHQQQPQPAHGHQFGRRYYLRNLHVGACTPAPGTTESNLTGRQTHCQSQAGSSRPPSRVPCRPTILTRWSTYSR